MLGTCSRSETDQDSHCLACISATLSVAQSETHPHNLKSNLVEPPPILDLLACQLLLCEGPALVRPGSTRASTLAVVKPPAQTVDIRLLREGGVFSTITVWEACLDRFISSTFTTALPARVRSGQTRANDKASTTPQLPPKTM